MSIRARLALGLFAIAVIMIAPLAFALHSLDSIHDETVDLRDRDFAASVRVSRLRSDVDDMRRAQIAFSAFPSDTTRDTLLARGERVATAAGRLRDFNLEQSANGIELAMSFAAVSTKLASVAVAEGRAVAADSMADVRIVPAIDRADSILRSAESQLRDRIGVRVEHAEAASGEAQRAAGIAFMLAGIAALVMGFILWRSIAEPLRDLDGGMSAVAGGEFGHRLRMSPKRKDEFGRLSGSFQVMAEQLAALDQLKAEFVSVASHELKTPINVILGYVQLLEEGVYGEVAPKQRDILATVEMQTRSLARLVHQLLDISRFEAGGGKIETRPVRLHGFLTDLEKTFRVLSLQRDVEFRIDQKGVLPDEVYWDADRINEVVGNLLSNAFKFTSGGESVTLCVEAVNHDVHLDVRDSGAGIAPEQLPHIFEKFYQANNQNSAAHAGTGLGLAIAKQIVLAHSGTISATSEPGVGTTFHITLPIRAATRLVPQERRPATSGALS